MRKHQRISVAQAEQGYVFFRVIPDYASDWAPFGGGGTGAKEIVEQPHIPTTAMKDENVHIPRVSLGWSILSAAAAIFGGISGSDIERYPYIEAVDGWYVYGVRKADTPRVDRDIHRFVPDAIKTAEVWAYDPVRLHLIGTFHLDLDDESLWIKTA